MKKLLSVLLAMAMIFSVIAVGCVNASAASIFDGAKKLDALEMVTLNESKSKVTKYYKISLPDSGKIRFHCDRHDSDIWHTIYIALINANGKTILEGKSFYDRLERDYVIDKKGTYYIKISKEAVNFAENFYYTFEPDESPTISFAVKLKVGDTLNVAATTSNYDGKVKWSTTKKAVATVSKGKVTAKKAGRARIRARMDNDIYAEILVIVEDDED